MVYYNSITNLKELKVKILTLQATEQDIINFIQEMNSIENFDCPESNLQILEIYLILKDMDKFIPLVNLSLDMLPAKIILADITDNIVNSSCEHKESKPCACDTIQISETCEKECEEIKTNCCNDNMANLRERLIAKWNPLLAQDPNVKRPAPGSMGNVYFVDNEIIPGKEYRSNVQIDHNANILYFISGPTEIVKEEDYEAIYSGLIGSLFDYQK